MKDEITLNKQLPEKGLTPRALIIGGVGCVVLTASSLFVALKMGALPWPIVFAALVSVVFLRLFKSRNLHEANVCHAVMSAGAMVAGGLAFTLPGLWILGAHSDGLTEISFWQILLTALSGTALGLIIAASLQPLFIRRKCLAYPIGTSAAQTLLATDQADGKDAKTFFGAMSLSALFALLRDNLGWMPAFWSAGNIIPGVSLGIMNSPMMASIGFIIGTIPAGVWFLGALISLLGIGLLLPALGIISAEAVNGWQTSLGLGLMMGTGAGAVLLNVFSAAWGKWKASKEARNASEASEASNESETSKVGGIDKKNETKDTPQLPSKKENGDLFAIHFPLQWRALIMSAVACLVCFLLHLPLVATIIILLGAWFCGFISAWLTGTTGVNPMEIFGVLVLLLIQLFCHSLSLLSLFVGAAIVAVACGIVGDVMNDFKAGDLLSTRPQDQYLGMVFGGLIGAVVASAMLFALFKVYGPDAFGPQSFFVSAQASVVATMAGGIPVVPVFIAGIFIGLILALCKLPVMTLGLGVYLPFYMSAAAFLGAALQVALASYDKKKFKTEKKRRAKEEAYAAAASGVLGGESLIGVTSALFALFSTFHF